MKLHLTRGLLVSTALAAGLGAAQAQDATAEAIAKYREMLQDGNPAELYEMKGEELWKQKRGPKNVSLEQCDLGKGPGVIKGAFVELPRYFKDTNRVEDLEGRIITCMETLQGFNGDEVRKTPFRRGEMADKYVIHRMAPQEERFRIMAVSGVRGHPPRVVDDRTYDDIKAAYHAVFLLRVNDLLES